MRIQLLHPPTFVAPGNLQTSRPSQPLGLAYIAGALRQAGHDCVVLDAIAEAPTQTIPSGRLMRLGLSDDEILDRIEPDAPALAITNMFSFNWPTLRELIRKVRVRFPEKTIVCGGEHFTGLPELCMRSAPIDYVVMGEGEEVAVELFARLALGRNVDAATIKGLCWRRCGEVVRNPRANRTSAVDDIAWPAWDLFDVESYNAHNLVTGLRFGKTLPILATRGCPYQCTYCSSPQMWTTRWYARDPVKVVDEIEHHARRWGANNFPMQDLTMIIKKDWIVQFCREIIDRGLDINWQLPSGTRCEVIDDDVASLLHQSGCRFICYAPESGSERTRELIKKKMKTASLLAAVDTSVKAHLRLETFFVIGFPHDTPKDLRESTRLARLLAFKGAEDIAVSFFFPIPATQLFNDLEKQGRVDTSDSQLIVPIFGHHQHLSEERNYCEQLSARQLTRWKYRIVASFYLTSWLTHPTRLFRVIWNALRGRETSVLEKFIGERVKKFVARRRRAVPGNRQLGAADTT
jgi:anaerobic magnesium-protoporphyrin IX monomethyl ester cyclase